jgi:hypothetical protein
MWAGCRPIDVALACTGVATEVDRFSFLTGSKMSSSKASMLHTPLEELRKKEAQGREATEERETSRLLYHIDIEDLERRLSYLETITDEKLEVEISGLTTSTLASDNGERCRLFSQLTDVRKQRGYVN